MNHLRQLLRRRPRSLRAYALPFVIVMLILLAVALSSMLFVLGAGARSTESMVGRRKAFYVCDGVGRLATIAAADYFAGLTGVADSEALKAHVQAMGGGESLPNFLAATPGYALQDFNIEAVGSRVLEPLASGPFKGMLAAQDGVTLSLGAVRTSTGWMCRQEQTVTLGKIAMFQFFIFSDQPYTDWVPGPPAAATGRVHANGTLCIGAGSDLWLDRVTAHGDILHSSSANCRDGTGGDGAHAVSVAFVDGATFDTNTGNTNPIEPNAAQFHDFGSTSRTASWASFALSEYGGHLLDAAHNVPELRLPVFGNVTVQQGYNASGSSPPPMANPATRVLVDPVLAGDAADVKEQKFAYQADLRIINGVWYLRDPANPDAWPGTPIWSDHPGQFTTTGEQGVEPSGRRVGQRQIATARSWGVNPPKQFSPYRFDASGNLTTSSSDPPAVVSYGILARDAGSGSALWGPGTRCKSDEANESVRPATSTALACDQANADAIDSVGERLLRGTRSGFRTGHVDRFEKNRSGGVRERANIVPINFDVAAFQRALATPKAGELGSYFTRRQFNGIVWISSTWDGSMAQPTAAEPPPQGSVDDLNQPTVLQQKEDDDALKPDKNLENRALPYPLCAGSSSSVAGHAIVDAADGNKATGFKVPSCADYGSSGAMKNARPNAVRIYNARNVNNAVDARPDISTALSQLPHGLTIVTNLPVYILGDVNVGSDPANLASTSPWVPVLIAGDVTHIQSNAWNDKNARWSKTINGDEVAAPTTMRFQMVSGWTPTTNTTGQYSGGLENFPRFLEKWTNVNMNIRGSFVVGWAAVYNRAPRQSPVYAPPNRDWGFDRHLEQLVNQPPGAPLFDVAAVRQWKR